MHDERGERSKEELLCLLKVGVRLMDKVFVICCTARFHRQRVFLFRYDDVK